MLNSTLYIKNPSFLIKNLENKKALQQNAKGLIIFLALSIHKEK